jgi:hypothetical protein
MEAANFWDPQGLSGPVTGLLCFDFASLMGGDVSLNILHMRGYTALLGLGFRHHEIENDVTDKI